MEAGSEAGSPYGSQTQRLDALEREGRFPELAAELQVAVGRAHGAERAALLARLGEARLRMDDVAHALSAFGESLELDPKQPASRRWLEVLLAEPEQAVQAAEILEAVYEREYRSLPHAASMLLAILELRANRATDQDERLAVWVQLGAVFDAAALAPERAREVSQRFLARTAQDWPGGVGKWIERVFRVSADLEERVQALRAALEQPGVDALTLTELSLAAGHTLEKLGRTEEARALYERALAADPSSPEVLDRVHSLATDESAEQRLERFRGALEQAQEPERRAALRVEMAQLYNHQLGQRERAAELLRDALAESPSWFRAHVALTSIYDEGGDDEALERELDRALGVFDGVERRQVLLRLGDFLLARGRSHEAMARTRSLLDEADLDEQTLEFLGRIAEESGHLPSSRKVHERRIESVPPGSGRARALESYAQFLEQRAADAPAAAEYFKRAAATWSESGEERSEPVELYERALALAPHDAEAARQLLLLCARSADWTQLPRLGAALLGAVPDAVDAVATVLALEARAAQTGGTLEFANLVDAVASRLDDSHVDETRALVAAKARVLTAAAQYEEAARVYEALIESFGDEPDVRAYVGLLESSPDAEFRHRKRCWLFEWRAARAEDPVPVFLHWATLEEQFGDVPSAIALLERAAAQSPSHRDVLSELVRLRYENGDSAGGFTALTRLREVVGARECVEVELAVVELLLERLEQPQDALPVLEAVLAIAPDAPRARELAQRLVTEFPQEEPLWTALESGAVRAAQPELALRAYEAALAHTRDPELAEQLGKRLIAFASEHVGDPAALMGALTQLLETLPTARWAFDRVKLSLTNAGHWQTLFSLYERVLGALSDERQRAQLLDEAAVAARDLANDPERAIDYWERFFALRPDDKRVDLALERLYEKHKKYAQLIRHLRQRETKLHVSEVARARERVAALWLELRDARQALLTIESLPDNVAHADATLALLERVFRLPLTTDADANAINAEQLAASADAAQVLKERYQALGRPADVAQVIELELPQVKEPAARVALFLRLSRLRQELLQPAAEFECLGELMLLEPEQAEHRARLGKLAEELGQKPRAAELTVLAAERVPGTALFGELLSAAAQIVLGIGERAQAIELYARVLAECEALELRVESARRLSKLLREANRPLERCSVLEQLAALCGDPAEWRSSLVEAARVALEELRDPGRAARDLRQVLAQHPNDPALVDALLRALRVAERWEEVVPVLEHRASLAEDDGPARRDLGEAASLRFSQLDDAPAAIVAWRAVRERFGSDTESFEQLAELLLVTARYTELAELLAYEAQRAEQPRALYARLAEVHRRYTGDLAAALQAYLLADDVHAAASLFTSHADLVPDDPSLALDIAERLAQSGTSEVAEQVLARQLEHYGPRRPREGVRAHLALAELCASSGDGARAIHELVRASTRYPDSGAVLSALGALSLRLGDLDRAEQSYRALLMLLGGGAAEGESGPLRSEVYLYLSQVAAERGDSERAEDHVGSAFEVALDSDQESLALETALRRVGRTDLVERAVTARLERAREPSKVVFALRDLLDTSPGSRVEADLAERALRIADRAASELEAEGGTAQEGLLALLAIYDRLAQKERALAVLQLLAARGRNAEERADFELRLAERWLTLPGKQPEAVTKLWGLVERDASLDRPYDLLSSLVTDVESNERLLATLRSQFTQAETAGNPARSSALGERLAQELTRLERWEEALQALQRLSREQPKQRDLREKIVALHERLGSAPADLAEALEAWLELEPLPEKAIALSLRLSDLRRELGDEAGLERALSRAFQLAPDRPELCEALVERLSQRGAYGRAIEVLERALERAPNDVELRRRFSDVLIAAGEPERALLALEAALSAGAPEAELRRERARILDTLGRTEEALTELDRALQVSASGGEQLLEAIERSGAHRDAEKWALRAADLCTEAAQRPRARALLEPWLKKNPDSAGLLTRVARFAGLDRDYAVALDAYAKLCRLEQGPARRSALLSLARVAEAAARPELAIPEVERALSEGPDADLRRELTRLYGRSGDKLKHGRLLLEEARSGKAPNQAELLVKAAEQLAGVAPEEALIAVADVRRLEPERLDAALLEADLLRKLDRADESRVTLVQLLTATERRRVKAHSKLYLKLAESWLAEADVPAAFEPLREAYQLDKADADAAFLLGMVASDLEHYETAFTALRAFISLKEKALDLPTRKQVSRAFFQLGELELSKGQRTVARRLFTRAVETDPENKAAQRLLTELNAR